MRFSVAAALVALVMVSLPVRAAPEGGLAGEWRNTKNTVHIRVAPCGGALCGTVTWADGPSQEKARKGSGHALIGSQVFRNLKPSGQNEWRGTAYIPDRDVTASATVTMVDPILLRVSGCVLFGLACKTQHWHRL